MTDERANPFDELRAQVRDDELNPAPEDSPPSLGSMLPLARALTLDEFASALEELKECIGWVEFGQQPDNSKDDEWAVAIQELAEFGQQPTGCYEWGRVYARRFQTMRTVEERIQRVIAASPELAAAVKWPAVDGLEEVVPKRPNVKRSGELELVCNAFRQQLSDMATRCRKCMKEWNAIAAEGPLLVGDIEVASDTFYSLRNKLSAFKGQQLRLLETLLQNGGTVSLTEAHRLEQKVPLRGTAIVLPEKWFEGLQRQLNINLETKDVGFKVVRFDGDIKLCPSSD